MTMKKRFYLGLIILAVLLLALGGLVVRSTAALFRMGFGLERSRRDPATSRVSMPFRTR